MPHRLDSGDELSLKYLPDASETSVSLQIPTSDKDDYLLANNHSNFFEGVDDSVATPPPFRTAYDALTISQLTPRPEGPFDFRFLENLSPPPQSSPRRTPRTTRKAQIKARLAAVQSSKSNTASPKAAPSSKPNLVTQPYQLPSGEASPSKERMRNLRAEVEMLTDDLDPAFSLVSQAPPPSAERAKPKGIMRQSSERNKSEVKSVGGESRVLRSKRTVIEGGITKSKNRPRQPPSSSSKVSRPKSTSPPVQPPVVADASTSTPMRHPQPEPELPSEMDVNETSPNISIMSTTSGVAGRLVSYGQQFIGSFGLVTSDKPSAPITNVPAPAPYPQLEPKASILEPVVASSALPDALPTISQFPPPKSAQPTPPSQAPEISASCSTMSSTSTTPFSSSSAVPAPPVSPMRSAIKRPRSTAPATTNKKSKTELSNFVVGSSKGNDREIEKTRSSARGQPKVLDSGSSSKSTSRGKPDSRLVQRRVERQGRQVPVNKSGNSQRHEREDVRARARTKVTKASTSRTTLVQASESVNSTRTQSQEDSDVGNSQPPPQGKHDLTNPFKAASKPTEFKFEVDSRIQVRKAQQQGADTGTSTGKSLCTGAISTSENSRKKRIDLSSRIPDFKALHAVRDAELAYRKENVRPTVPVPIEFATEYRAKERRRFEEHVLEVEREREREREARRREREAEEEREIRELRKKAVPRAHVVPEWYKNAPKRKDRERDSA